MQFCKSSNFGFGYICSLSVVFQKKQISVSSTQNLLKSNHFDTLVLSTCFVMTSIRKFSHLKVCSCLNQLILIGFLDFYLVDFLQWFICNPAKSISTNELACHSLHLSVTSSQETENKLLTTIFKTFRKLKNTNESACLRHESISHLITKNYC